MTTKLVSILSVATLLVGVAVADDSEKSMTSQDATFKSMDQNADSRLSKAEVVSDTMLAEHFADVDGDSDGYLSMREYSAHMKNTKKGMKDESAARDR